MNMTARAIEYSDNQGHRLPMSTGAAGLTRIGRIDFHQVAASFFRFARQLTEKCRPGGVCNTFGKTMVMHHAVEHQVFDRNHAKSIHNGTAMLVSKVLAPPRNAFIHAGYHFAMLPALWCAFCKLAVFALHFSKGFLFLAKEARVDNLF